MSGFIYIWKEVKLNKYYIGSHWGNENDGYICSSSSMRKQYERHPKNFKRRIIAKVNTNRQDLLHEEQRWIDMIPREEFGRKYYNINAKVVDYLWWINEETKKQVSEKISRANKGKQQPWVSETNKKRRGCKYQRQQINYVNPFKGKKHSKNSRLKMSKNRSGISSWNKGLKISGMSGKKHSEEAKQKIGLANSK